MKMPTLPEVNLLKLTAQEYISIQTYIYEIQIPKFATVFVAIHRESVDAPEVLIHSD